MITSAPSPPGYNILCRHQDHPVACILSTIHGSASAGFDVSFNRASYRPKALSCSVIYQILITRGIFDPIVSTKLTRFVLSAKTRLDRISSNVHGLPKVLQAISRLFFSCIQIDFLFLQQSVAWRFQKGKGAFSDSTVTSTLHRILHKANHHFTLA